MTDVGVRYGRQLTIKFANLSQKVVAEAGLMTADMATFFQKDGALPVLSVYDETYLSAGQLIAFSKLSYDANLTKLFMFKKL